MSDLTYPPQHREIVRALTSGSFLTTSDALFMPLSTASAYYGRFFAASFDVKLCLTTSYAVLEKEGEKDTFSRDVVLLLGCICAELARQERPIRASLYENRFDVAEWLDRLENSAAQERLLSSIPELKTRAKKERFLRKMHKRGLVRLDSFEASWRWTEAVGWFLEWVTHEENIAK